MRIIVIGLSNRLYLSGIFGNVSLFNIIDALTADTGLLIVRPWTVGSAVTFLIEGNARTATATLVETHRVTLYHNRSLSLTATDAAAAAATAN